MHDASNPSCPRNADSRNECCDCDRMPFLNDECSHVQQWEGLKNQAANFGLEISFTSSHFELFVGVFPTNRIFALRERKKLGQYLTLADLSGGISDYVAGERAAKRMK